MTAYTITPNTKFNSLEITFETKPDEAIRNILKGFKFRWNPNRSLWYGFGNKEEIENALSGKEVKQPKEKTKAESKFLFDVKVGDLFYMSWGYEQTNVDFFQVVELVGTRSVRIREVQPNRIKEEAYCSMSANRTYEVPTEILPARNHSIFIKDNEKGDRKQLKVGYDNETCFTVSDKTCYKYNGEALYESWYY